MQLAVDLETRSSEISAEVKDGVVYLRGETMTRREQRRAEAIATAVRGVDAVVNDLRLWDSVVEANVYKALAADPVVGQIHIRVQSEGGIVRLESADTIEEQRKRVRALVLRVDGVRGISDFMR